MSIQLSRNIETLITDSEDVIGNSDSSSMSIIGLSHFEHVDSVRFFEFKKRDKKFAKMSQKVTSEFNPVKKFSGWFSSANNFDSSKFSVQFINEIFVNAMHLKFEHIVRVTPCSWECSFRNEKTSITVDKTCKVNQIFSTNFFKIQKIAALTHKSSFLGLPVIVTECPINVYRDRLSERTPKGEAIVGP